MIQNNEIDTEMNEPEVTADTTDDVLFEEVNEDLPAQAGGEATIKKLREKVKQLEKEKQDNQNGWTRAQADYVNFKKEVELRRKDDIVFANKSLIEDLLPVLDAYTMAQANTEAWEKVDANWRKGIEYIFSQMEQVLGSRGLTSYGAIGEKFDPERHESVEMVPVDDEAKDGTIVTILQKGYALNGKTVRVARVKVGHISTS